MFSPFDVTTSTTFDLDQVWIGINNRSTSFDIDNLVVTAIPEPSVYAALVGFLALGLVAWRRRSAR